VFPQMHGRICWHGKLPFIFFLLHTLENILVCVWSFGTWRCPENDRASINRRPGADAAGIQRL
jgi:hypothetical protein